MICSNCGRLSYKGDRWMKVCQPLIGSIVFTDLVGINEECEKFCSKECALEYISKNNLSINLDNIKIDIIEEN